MYKYKEFKNYDWTEIGRGKISGYLDFLISRIIFGTSLEQYVCLEFYRKSFWERKQYMTARKSSFLIQRVNATVPREIRHKIGSKHLFNMEFKEFIHRDYILSVDVGEKKIKDFVKKH